MYLAWEKENGYTGLNRNQQKMHVIYYQNKVMHIADIIKSGEEDYMEELKKKPFKDFFPEIEYQGDLLNDL